MTINEKSPLFGIDPALLKGLGGGKTEFPDFMPVTSHVEVVESDLVEHMLALAPQFGLVVEIVARPGETATDFDFSTFRPEKAITVREGNLAVRVTNPENIDTGPFRLALREMKGQKKAE